MGRPRSPPTSWASRSPGGSVVPREPRPGDPRHPVAKTPTGRGAVTATPLWKASRGKQTPARTRTLRRTSAVSSPSPSNSFAVSQPSSPGRRRRSTPCPLCHSHPGLPTRPDLDTCRQVPRPLGPAAPEDPRYRRLDVQQVRRPSSSRSVRLLVHRHPRDSPAPSPACSAPSSGSCSRPSPARAVRLSCPHPAFLTPSTAESRVDCLVRCFQDNGDPPRGPSVTLIPLASLDRLWTSARKDRLSFPDLSSGSSLRPRPIYPPTVSSRDFGQSAPGSLGPRAEHQCLFWNTAQLGATANVDSVDPSWVDSGVPYD